MDGRDFAHAHTVSEGCLNEIREHLARGRVRAVFEVTNQSAFVVVADLPDKVRNGSRTPSCNKV